LPSELHFQLEGSERAPTVVLLNSLGSDLHMWDGQIGPLQERFRVLRCDLRGHGRSPVPPGPYSIDDLGADVLALLDRLEIARAGLCGVSLGGAVAMWLCVHAPERVERLAVCFSAARFGVAQDYLQRAALVRAEGTAAVADAVLARWFTAATARAQPELIARMREMIAATPREGYAASCEAIAALDLSEELASILAPTLVLSGSEDPATPPELGRQLADAIPNAAFVELAAAAHLGNVERPDAFNRVVTEHLDAERPASPTISRHEAKETSR
jgi:3-oxoadipate enol-lactonase